MKETQRKISVVDIEVKKKKHTQTHLTHLTFMCPTEYCTGRLTFTA